MEYDLHVHSYHSFDSTMRPQKIIEVARKRGLHGVAIVDHDRCDGALEAMEIAPSDFIVIPGFERGTKAGDIIGLFLTEVPETDDPLEVVEWIKAHDGVAVLAHPFAYRLSVEERLARALQAVEGFNARHTNIRILDMEYGEEQIRAFAAEHGLSLVAGSDAHFYREIGRARTVIPASTLDEIKHAILSGNTLLVGRRTHPLLALGSVVLGKIKMLLSPPPKTILPREKQDNREEQR